MAEFTRLKAPVTLEQFLIDRDLSGGCRLRLGPASFVMSPEKTVEAATAMLRCVDIEVMAVNPGQTIIRPMTHGERMLRLLANGADKC